MSKSADAFRTISEVAEWLDTPAHVLRFWESKFTQVKPVKRAGGRRYYRPADMRLLGGIKKLLHEDGMTIKGAQKILREQGIKHVASLCTLSVGDDEDYEDVTIEEVFASDPVDTVVPFAKPAEPAEEPPAAVVEDDVAEGAAPDAAGHDPDGAEDAAELDLAEDTPDDVAAPTPAHTPDTETEDPSPVTEAGSPALPGFLQRSMEDRLDAPEGADDAGANDLVEVSSAAPTAAAVPERKLVLTLSHLARIKRLPPDIALEIAPLAEQLRKRAS